MDNVATNAVPQAFANAFAFSLNGPERDREFVLDFVDKATRAKQRMTRIWDEAQDNYLVCPVGQRTQFILPFNSSTGMPLGSSLAGDRQRRAILKDPELHQVTETLTAQAIGLLLSSRDYIQVVPVGADDYEKARMLGRLLMALLEQPGWYRTHYQAIKNAFIYGTSIVELTWATRSRPQMTRIPQFDELGQQVGYSVEPRETIYQDGPLFRECDIYDFYPDPSGTRIHYDMVGVAKRGEMTKATARELADAGTYPYRDAVQRAINYAKGAEGYSERGGPMRWPEDTKAIPDDFGKLCFFEYWGKVPYRTQDGAPNRVITILNDQCVRSHINPFIDGMIPFKEIVVNPIAGRFYGLSPLEVLRYLQDSTDNMLMVLNDAANQAVEPSMVIGTAFGGDPEAVRKRERIIEARNVDAVKPLSVDLNALQFAGVELFRRKASIREASGANAQQLLSSEGGDRTATAASELVRLTSQRVELMVQLMEKDDYPWIGRTLHSRLRQFLPSGGGSALFRGETMQFGVEDIDFDADVRFVGSRHNMSAFQVLAQYREALNVLGTNPAVVMQFPELIIRYLRDGLKILDAERIVSEAVKQYQIMQAKSVLMGAQGEAGASVSNSLEGAMGTESGGAEREGVRMA